MATNTKIFIGVRFVPRPIAWRETEILCDPVSVTKLILNPLRTVEVLCEAITRYGVWMRQKSTVLCRTVH